MIRGMDGYVMRLMAGVKTRVYEQPGLLSYKILVGKKGATSTCSWGISTTDTQCAADARGGRAVWTPYCPSFSPHSSVAARDPTNLSDDYITTRAPVRNRCRPRPPRNPPPPCALPSATRSCSYTFVHRLNHHGTPTFTISLSLPHTSLTPFLSRCSTPLPLCVSLFPLSVSFFPLSLDLSSAVYPLPLPLPLPLCLPFPSVSLSLSSALSPLPLSLSLSVKT